MYTARPLGINIKQDDGEVKDGFLRESINLQWRNGAFRPIPERLVSAVNVSGYSNIILHKVSDEDQINVLGFDGSNDLYWIGKLVNGVYSSITPVDLGVDKTDGLSFTVLNGLIYFMGDGSSTAEQYYTRLQFNESDEAYESKNMYAWKSLIPFYPRNALEITAPNNTYNVMTECGLILIRYTLVLNTGEEVLHSPIYGSFMYGLNRSGSQINVGDTIENIHTVINLDFDFADDALLAEQVSAINIYATTPYYETKIKLVSGTPGTYETGFSILEQYKGEFQKKAEEPFYLIKTIEKPTDDRLVITIDSLDADIEFDQDYTQVNGLTIAAGEVMPVDNFSYHSLYGKITSYNGRLIVESPRTVFSAGHFRALALQDVSSDVGFRVDTEDGTLSGIAYRIDKRIIITENPVASGNYFIQSRGLLSYPDRNVNIVGGNEAINDPLMLIKSRGNKLHNISCVFDIVSANRGVLSFDVDPGDSAKLIASTLYGALTTHGTISETTSASQPIIQVSYSSENREQFSAAGEFSVWPAINSERVGEGKIISTGANNVNPTDADITAPLYVGTSDGLYTINFDPTGVNLIASITRRLKYPFISSEVLQIGNAIVFVSDKGLIMYSEGDWKNLTFDFFPDQGNGNYPDLNTVLPNYNLLTTPYFGSGSPYTLNDIVEYMRGAIMAYDGRRNTIWCSNPSKNFSLLYALDFGVWGMSTLVFTEKSELNNLIASDEGDIYSRYLVKKTGENNLLILSGEDLETMVDVHLLTRPIKLNSSDKTIADKYKKISRLIARCELFRNSSLGYFVYGVWGKQDHAKSKVNIPIAAFSDSSSASFPDNIRQDIPIGRQKGKYKDISILIGGKVLPESSIKGFEFDALLVDEKQLR